MDVFNPGSHGSTFGGNALAAAVALEALQVIEDEHLVQRSADLGEYLDERLRAVAREAQPLIRAVRGRGLWVGVDIDPRHATARELVERLAARGVLSKETHDTVIRFAPPLTITQGADRSRRGHLPRRDAGKARRARSFGAPAEAARSQGAGRSDRTVGARAGAP